MISTIFGLPGAGKSSLLAWAADQALHDKPLSVGHAPFWRVSMTDHSHYDRVYCNFPIKGTYMLQWDDLGKYDFSNSLILIDEITLSADSRKWKNFGDDKVYFFSMHRHYNCDILIAAQAYDRMDRTIRDLSAKFFYLRNEGSKTRIIPISRDWQPEKMSEKFSLEARLSCSMLKRKNYYHMFDSFACAAMPANPANMWEVV